jgi:ribonucleoside-triphosphate reductase
VTEVYSRITGYYRPVQNWNDGKLQEYANRTEYIVSPMDKPVDESCDGIKAVSVKETKPQLDNVDISNILLFTTKTCPNCRLAKEYLKDMDYVTIDAEENSQLAVEYGVMQAPTLVIVTGQHSQKYVNVSNIKKYAQEYKGA